MPPTPEIRIVAIPMLCIQNFMKIRDVIQVSLRGHIRMRLIKPSSHVKQGM
jgi:hypothetical protein